MSLNFVKMHSLGNDFIIIDARQSDVSGLDIKLLCDRKFGIGCDQLILIEHSKVGDAYVAMVIYNSDGSMAGACGNATRCVADLLMRKLATDNVRISVKERLLDCWHIADCMVKVNMGEPLFRWDEIPLSYECDFNNIPLENKVLQNPFVVNMGNPHAVFFIDNVDDFPLEHHGPIIANDSMFPESANVEIISVKNDRIRTRVWERGAGETLACGSGACAVFVASHKRGKLSGDKAKVVLNGGILTLEWSEEDVLMTGPITYVYSGTI